MYAIIRAGGKQYKVQAGDTVRVEKIEKSLGEQFDLPEVLLVGGEQTYIGEPLLQGAKVTVVVTRQAKAPKIIVFKKKRRQGYRRMQGHRQFFTELFVKSITSPGGQTVQTEKNPMVVDPVKTEAKKAAAAAAVKERKSATTSVEPEVAAAPQKKAAKKTAKKAAKKAGAKKTVKKAAKKAGGKKAGAKKTAAKKA